MRIYAYYRVDEFSVVEINYADYFLNFGYQVQNNRIITEYVNVETLLEYRSKFINLVEYTLESGDILIINGIDSLGCDFEEIYSSVNYIFKKEIRLVCIEFSKKEIVGSVKFFFFHFLKMCADFDKKFQYGKRLKNKNTKKVGRSEILNKSQKEEILDKLKKGHSVYSIAKKYSVSRTVIQRLIGKSSIKINYKDI